MNYKKIKYPDGQISVETNGAVSNTIAERINSYEDLFFIKSIVDASGRTNIPNRLFIPCLFGQRSDRRFAPNQSFDLKHICEFINGMHFDEVQIFDPHSDVSLALINRSVKLSSKDYILKTLFRIEKGRMNFNEFACLVSPDAGAYKKVFSYGAEFNLPVVAANKFRDKDGNITLNFLGDVKDKECLIIDDICDGGYTFYLLAKALREQGASKVYLYVSHGYFSKGFITPLDKNDENSSLSKFLDGIYCTNSVKDVYNNEFDGYKTHNLGNLITQYKII